MRNAECGINAGTRILPWNLSALRTPSFAFSPAGSFEIPPVEAARRRIGPVKQDGHFRDDGLAAFVALQDDDHLEQYLCPGFRLAKPSVIVTKHLSANAMKVIKNSQGTDVKALCAVSNTDLRTRIITSSGEELIVDECLWNLESFNKGII